MGVSSPTGRFGVKQVGSRWMLVTPEGNGMWMLGVYVVDVAGTVDDMGDSYTNRIKKKYGDSDLTWGPQQNRRLQSWGFNTIGEYSSKWVLPWTTATTTWPRGEQPVKMPAVPFPVYAALYSQRNLFDYAPGPVKEIYWATSSYYKGYRGQFPDIFDPNFDRWIAGWVAKAAGKAPSQWAVGISSDDTDYLTGFGGGPDFPVAGSRSHPHLGYVTLVTKPTQAASKDGTIRYSDTTVYIKAALADFLRSRYGTIAALNAAWGSTYTTFGSHSSRGGLLDEDGAGSWVGSNAYTLADAAPRVKADLDEFLFLVAQKYFTIYRNRIRQYCSSCMYLGPTTLGAWGIPPRRQILQAARGNVDIIRTSLNRDDLQEKLEFIASHAGNTPLLLWVGMVGNADSAMQRLAPSTGLPSQEARGALYAQAVQSYFNVATSSSRVNTIIGFQFWQYTDNLREKANWGLVTLSDNAYDGHEAVRAPGRDPWGFATGGELADYGDFVSAVKATNEWVVRQLGGTTP
jgi:hypothetical protein